MAEITNAERVSILEKALKEVTNERDEVGGLLNEALIVLNKQAEEVEIIRVKVSSLLEMVREKYGR